MSAGTFKITEHTVPACHIREYPGSTAKSQEEALSLHVKQYTPLDQHGPVPSDAVTVIAAHACGFPKELYEPLWDEIHHRLKRKGLHIRSIWIADAANMGMSGVLNEDKISNEYSWNDSARDLLMLINHFREQMPRPLVGIGHSFGGNILYKPIPFPSHKALPLMDHLPHGLRTNLALMHPRLLTTVVLLDPVIQTAGADRGIGTDPPGAVNYTLWRPDRWPNRKAAASAHAKIWQRWDRRCVDRMIKFGFRDLPTALYPEMPGGSDRSDPPVTLTTTKYQEATSLYRANFFAAHASDGRIPIDRSVHPDLDPVFAFQPVFRPESRMIALRLPTLRPPVLWILGEESFLGIDNIRASVQTCGTGVGGSGGVSQGQVKEIILSGCGHLLPFEAVDQTADHCADWIVQEIGKYGELERVWNQHRQSMSQRDHVVLGADWFELVKMPKALQRTSRAGKL